MKQNERSQFLNNSTTLYESGEYKICIESSPVEYGVRRYIQQVDYAVPMIHLKEDIVGLLMSIFGTQNF